MLLTKRCDLVESTACPSQLDLHTQSNAMVSLALHKQLDAMQQQQQQQQQQKYNS